MSGTQTRSRRQYAEADLVVTVQPLTTLQFSRYGRTYHCMAVTTDGVVQIGLSQGAQSGRSLYKGVGAAIPDDEPDFDYVEFYNTSNSVAQTVTLQTSFGHIIDSRFNIVAGGGTVPTAAQSPSTLTSTGDAVVTGAAAIVLAANANRKEAFITNRSTTTYIRVGDSLITAARGDPIAPGAFKIITNTAAIYAISEGANATVNLMESST